ncbi:GNAT family N-acetyltransferase [Paucibacter sp. DJ2R-2]|uniref:GNAT family N-acetyltransferase n=1 Tax=Paucibacter sp. DJ2R-2 TaxID=2893558 RepID=UPI0021E3BEAE|nr:GNAT family N-acetyltransferase [Paucibacter sp. DJ2R-2]MCV2422887.1 GNAT family N-acetyltransferase [Paucibacter sp. DJ4R-1]MCV2440783.1 GNAT family N-acetyltransferase [Paucibacter sp. DJ2R-2]
MSAYQLQPVAAEDLDALFQLRMEALRPSLERLGRYDLARSRERFQTLFDPATMRHICRGSERVGFLMLHTPSTEPAILRLEQLYLQPAAQSQGIGAWVLSWAKDQARRAGRDLSLSALKLSNANRFYLRHGFKAVGESEFDIDYLWRLPVVGEEARLAQVPDGIAPVWSGVQGERPGRA